MGEPVKLRWVKAKPPTIGKVLALNGAHKEPQRYYLTDDSGKWWAVVQEQAGLWVWWVPPSGPRSSPFTSADAAKAAARNGIRAGALVA